MLGLYECMLSMALVFLELLQNLFALCAELTKMGLVYALWCSDFSKKVSSRGDCLAISGPSGANCEIASSYHYLSLFFMTHYS